MSVARLYTLLTAGTGVIRTRHPDLEREAAERAREARDQVGLVFTDTDADKIRHPSQDEREGRLGPEWEDLQVVEVATWLYQWRDPIKALVDSTAANGNKVGLLNSEPHRTILMDPSYMYWGAGLYDELPPGEPEINRRYYGIVWVSKRIPPMPDPEQTFTDVPPTHPHFADVEWAAANGITAGVGGGKFDPDKPVTRAQMTAFLRRLYRTLED